MEKLDKIYINSESNRLLKISKNDFIKYKNQIFPNNLNIHWRACDAASSYHCPSPISGSNIPRWECIFNCCYDCRIMNAPYLESLEQLDGLFPTYHHEIEFRIFKNISKCFIHVLIPFEYNNMCELCDNIQYKDKGVRNVLFFMSTLLLSFVKIYIWSQ